MTHMYSIHPWSDASLDEQFNERSYRLCFLSIRLKVNFVLIAPVSVSPVLHLLHSIPDRLHLVQTGPPKTRFHEWPAEALYSVAKQQITGQNVELPNLEGALKMPGAPDTGSDGSFAGKVRRWFGMRGRTTGCAIATERWRWELRAKAKFWKTCSTSIICYREGRFFKFTVTFSLVFKWPTRSLSHKGFCTVK